jgi:hypothetical protein
LNLKTEKISHLAKRKLKYFITYLEVEAPGISRQSAYEGGKIVGRTGHLDPPGDIPGNLLSWKLS